MVKFEFVEALLYHTTVYGSATWTPPKSHYNKLHSAHHIYVPSSSCSRILFYKDGLQRTGCESIEATVRTRLLWAGLLLHMDDNRLPKRIASGELENAGCGSGGRRRDVRTAWQTMVGCLASRETEVPRTRPWDFVTQHAKRVGGLWPRGRGKRKMRQKTGRGRERRKRFLSRTWGDLRKILRRCRPALFEPAQVPPKRVRLRG